MIRPKQQSGLHGTSLTDFTEFLILSTNELILQDL